MLRIFGYSASINVRKVLWLCEELGLDYTREDWAGGFRSTADPAFRKLNPVGLVPVIDDDGVVLWESNTILRYLAASRGRDDLLPRDPVGRAMVEKWMDWQASDFNNSWRVAFQGLVRGNPLFQDAAVIARSLHEVGELAGRVSVEIARSGGYICGERFTLADIPIGLSIHRWRTLPAERPHDAVLDDYLDRLSERAGFRTFGRNGGS